MTTAKFRSQLLDLVDSDSDDGLSGGLTRIVRPAASAQRSNKAANINTSKMSPAKKGARGRQAANKVTKPAAAPKTSTRAVNGRIAAAAEEELEDDRSALIEKPANAQPKLTGRGRKRAAAEEEAEDVVMADAPAPKAARGRPKKTAVEEVPDSQPPPPTRGRRVRKAAPEITETVEEEPEEEDEKEVEEATEIPETQPQRLVEQEEDEEEEEEEQELEVPGRFPPDPPRGGGRNAPPLTAPPSAARRPMYGAPAHSDSSDPALRRRLGEMTQKYESLEVKYQNLREIAVKEADSNFDRLKKQTDEKSRAADDLIASLKAELAAQKEASKDTHRLQTQLEASEAKAETLQSKITQLTTSLSESKTEIKALNMKLAAARTAEAAAAAKATATATVPGSAVKGSHASRMNMMTTSNSEAVRQATVNGQKREDLYADLTGLIIRTMGGGGPGAAATTGKGEDPDDVLFDCLQTGRNGTLHFKLREISDDGMEDAPEEPQLRYLPQLNADRDQELIKILPNFLVDEIEFPRSHVDKFYARVVKALTGA